jgi:hypothetical protein
MVFRVLTGESVPLVTVCTCSGGDVLVARSVPHSVVSIVDVETA